MRVVIATVQVPFIRGGAEILADGLREALRAHGHEAEIVAVPFKWYPPERILDHMLVCRLLDLTEVAGTPIDRIIGLKFPAYLISHPNKVLWLLHQHRQAYDLWENASLGGLLAAPNGVQVREAILHADRHLIPEAKAIYTIAANVSRRLRQYCAIESVPLYHPPKNAEKFYCAKVEEYFFFPSRLLPTKRQALVLEALAFTRQPVRVRFAGAPDQAAHGEELRGLARQFRVQRRVEWLGEVSEEEKIRQYAYALGVIFPPVDEDYGYVTLEAMLAAKPVITCADSGGPLEFIAHGDNGLVVEPTAPALAEAMDTLWCDRAQAQKWGARGRQRYADLNISWTTVVRQLLA